ncbi:MAG: aldehyde dehydrogenase family protein, partial [Povalibacter sp.]
MYDFRKFFIDGTWTSPQGRQEFNVINPATEQPIGRILLGTAEDVNAAAAAAKRAFETFSQTTREERIDLLERILKAFEPHMQRLAQAISDEMGAPMKLALNSQAASGPSHFAATLAALKEFEFEEQIGSTRLRREPVGVCGLITPWNWPMNQIVAKVGPALAAGCTMILKPSEEAPSSAAIFAEVMDAAGVPAGVFNLVQGDGEGVGTAMAKHPGIDMISFTGSTRAGIMVAKNAADTVKRVAQELGGKSPNI